MPKTTQYPLAAIALIACLPISFAANVAEAQVNHAEVMRRNQQDLNAQDAARSAYSAAKRSASIAKRQRNASVKQLEKQIEKSIVPLSKEHLAEWTKVKTARYSYWEYAIKRNGAANAIAAYNPKVGYVINGKFQSNGLAWPTLDEALQDHFGKDGLWTLPDIPGWSKSHLLTSGEQIADLKRQAMARAKPKVVEKIADAVADGIVDRVGPKIGADIGKDLGIDNPFSAGAIRRDVPAEKKPVAKAVELRFERLDEDRDKIRFGDKDGSFAIYEYKDGSGFEVLRLNRENQRWSKYEEVFPNLQVTIPRVMYQVE